MSKRNYKDPLFYHRCGRNRRATVEIKEVTGEGGCDILLNGQRVAFIDVFDERKPKLVIDLSENEQVFAYPAPSNEECSSVSVPLSVQLEEKDDRNFLVVPTPV